MKITTKRCTLCEAYHAEKDGKEFQVEVRLEDGTANDPKKCTVIIDGDEATTDVKGGEDALKKAIKAGAEKLGFKIVEARAKVIVPKFVQINTQKDFDKYIKPALGKGVDAYGLDDIKGMWWELEEGSRSSTAKTVREIRDNIDKRPRFIFISGTGYERGITDMSLTEYADNMGMSTKDYLDGWSNESNKSESRPSYYDHPLIMAITYKGSTIYCGAEDGDMWSEDIEDAYVWDSFDTISTIAVENFVVVAKEALESRWISEDNVEYLPAPAGADESKKRGSAKHTLQEKFDKAKAKALRK